MRNVFSDKVSLGGIVSFTIPTIFMMLFMSVYTMVDGIFVAQFVGTSALSAVNIVYPMLSTVIAMAVMIGTGGSAIVARQLGEGNGDLAKKNFSLFVFMAIAIGILLMVVGLLFLEPILKFLGANDAIMDYCVAYATPLLFFAPAGMLQILFQYFFVTAGKPTLGLAVIIAGGVANIVLDYIFIVPLNLGIAGAAIATGIGFSIPAVTGIIYFSVARKGTLYIGKTTPRPRVMLECCSNGSSEMVSNMSMAVTTMLFNIEMMRLLGEDGVAAITVVLYAEFFLTAVYLGYCSGVSPIISYNYGNKNAQNLRRLFKMSLGIIMVSSAIMFAVAMIFSGQLVSIFAKPGSEVYNIALEGMRIYSFSFLLSGLNIFASALFTALSNGKISALLSFLRTFLFIAPAIIILPHFWQTTGVWMAVVIANILAIIFSAFFVLRYKKTYQY